SVDRPWNLSNGICLSRRHGLGPFPQVWDRHLHKLSKRLATKPARSLARLCSKSTQTQLSIRDWTTGLEDMALGLAASDTVTTQCPYQGWIVAILPWLGCLPGDALIITELVTWATSVNTLCDPLLRIQTDRGHMSSTLLGFFIPAQHETIALLAGNE